MNSPVAKRVFAQFFPDETDGSKNAKLFYAIFDNDIPTVREILETELVEYKVPVFSLAVLSGNYELVKFLIHMGCMIRQSDELIHSNPLHWAVSNQFQLEINASTTTICIGCAYATHQRNLIKLLIENQSRDDAFENIFIDIDPVSKISPFYRACDVGCDESIQIFLDFLSSYDGKREIPIKKLSSNIGNIFRAYFRNALNSIFGGLKIANESQPRSSKPAQCVVDSRMRTLRALIEKMPHLEQLLTSSAGRMPPPLELLMQPIAFGQPKEEFRRLIDLLGWIADRGVPLDTVQRDDSRGFLEIAVASQNEEYVEMLLRAGCQLRYGTFSTLSVALFRGVQRNLHPQRPSIRIIELLLAFGLDLKKEIYLYNYEELPPNFDWQGAVFSHMAQPNGAPKDILEALKALRRKNTSRLINLQHLCRKSIREHLKPRADQVIEKLDCIPLTLKKFLLVEKETGLLGI